MKERFTDERIIGFLKEAEAGTPVKGICRKHGFLMRPFTGGAASLAAWRWRTPLGCVTSSQRTAA
jgi:hypothetical protein